jgi:hypothetical protein
MAASYLDEHPFLPGDHGNFVRELVPSAVDLRGKTRASRVGYMGAVGPGCVSVPHVSGAVGEAQARAPAPRARFQS